MVCAHGRAIAHRSIVHRKRDQCRTAVPRLQSVAVREGSINDAVVNGLSDRANTHQGSKLAGHVKAMVAPGATFVAEVRFTAEPQPDPFADFAAIFTERIAEADEFYNAVHPAQLSADQRLVQRQAFAGLLWSKQFYHYNVFRWLSGDTTEPRPPGERWHGRNYAWKHLATMT